MFGGGSYGGGGGGGGVFMTLTTAKRRRMATKAPIPIASLFIFGGYEWVLLLNSISSSGRRVLVILSLKFINKISRFTIVRLVVQDSEKTSNIIQSFKQHINTYMR